VGYFEMEDDNDTETLGKVVRWLAEREVNKNNKTAATSSTKEMNASESVANNNKSFPTLVVNNSSALSKEKPEDEGGSFELKKLLTDSVSCMTSVFPWNFIDLKTVKPRSLPV